MDPAECSEVEEKSGRKGHMSAGKEMKKLENDKERQKRVGKDKGKLTNTSGNT